MTDAVYVLFVLIRARGGRMTCRKRGIRGSERMYFLLFQTLRKQKTGRSHPKKQNFMI